MALWAHVFRLSTSNFSGVGNRPKSSGGIINEDLNLWISELTVQNKASQGDYSTSTLPPAGTVFGIPPLPKLPSLHEFVRGRGTLFKLLRVENTGGGRQQAAQENSGGGVVVAPKSKRRKSNTCYQFLEQDTCTYGDKCENSPTIPLRQPRPVPQSGEGRGGKAEIMVQMLALGGGGGGALSPLVVRAVGGGGQRARGETQGIQGGRSGRGAPSSE